MEQESVSGNDSKPSSLSIFVYPLCCPVFFLFFVFLAPVLASEWPAALPSPLSPHEQTAPCQMDFLYTMPHCVLALFLDTFGGLKKKNNKNKKTTGNVKEIFKNHCLSMLGRLHRWTVMNLWHAYKVDAGDHCKHLCFAVFHSGLRITPAAPQTAPFAAFCCSGQHHGQHPAVPVAAWVTQNNNRSANTHSAT